MSEESLDIPIGVDLTPFKTAMARVRAEVTTVPKLDIAPIDNLNTLKSSVENVATAASDLQFDVNGISTAFNGVAVASRQLSLVSQHFGILGKTINFAGAGANYLAAAIGLISTMATYLAAGIGMVIAPLTGLIIIPKLIAGAFSLMFAVVLTPFKLMFAAVKTVARAMWLLLQPVLKVAAAVFKLKVFFASLRIQLKMLSTFFALLPPKLRLVVGGLMAVGMAGRAGSVALNLFGKALGVAAFAALAIKSPLKAIGFAALKTALTIGRLTRSVVRATKALIRFAFAKTIAGLKGVGAASLNVAKQIGGRLLGSLKAGAVALGLLAIAGAGWGVALAADAEQAEIAFTTMLKSGDAAKAVLAELETFAASTPFQLDSLRDGAKQLLNAGVPADMLTNKLTMLGDIAAGTGKPIGDFVKIFSKVRSTGKVSLETLNQLAERGVPIYTALQQQLGVSREEMLSMISKGKVGFTDLNAALESTATGAGVFAGGMAAQSQTVSGLFSTLKDNVGFAMRELGVELIHAFDFKGLMADGIGLFQSLKAGIAAARPAFMATATVVKAAFAAVWEVVTVVFNGITSALGLTGGNFMATFMEWAAIATWAFKAWPDIAMLAFTNVQLWLVQLGAEFVHHFTVRLPTIIGWFADNFVNIFTTIGSFVASFFTNMASNIFAVMSAVWDYLASGGTSSFEVAWTPLLDGFENSISKLPDIPDRAISELERGLMNESENLAGALGNSLAAEIDANMQMLNDFQNQQVETPTIPPITAQGDQTVDEDTTPATSGSKSIGDALDNGSAEALKAIFTANRDEKVAQKQLEIQKRQEALQKQQAADQKRAADGIENLQVAGGF